MKKAPKNKVLFSQSRCEVRHKESISTQQKDKQEIHQCSHPARNVSLGYLYNPSAPITDGDLAVFIDEVSQILGDKLDQLEMKGGEPCSI